MMEDRILIWKFKRGSQDALRWIYEKYRLDLLKLAISLAGDVNAAEDIVQDVFVSFAWGEVAKNVQGSPNVIFRSVIRNTPDPQDIGFDYGINHLSGHQWRLDKYKGGKLIGTLNTSYDDSDTGTTLVIDHIHKYCSRVPHRGKEKPNSLSLDPNSLVQRFVSREHKRLHPKTIDGVTCEGIETNDPTVFPGGASWETFTARIWVRPETGYPVRIEGECTYNRGRDRFTFAWDQFQWDAQIGPSIFEPNIPPDYTHVSP